VTSYALQAPAFPFRALAALAGRANLGGERETVLAVYMAARLACGTLPPRRLTDDARRGRATAARTWLVSLALPAPIRAALSRVIDAVLEESDGALADALALVTTVASGQLDGAAQAELAALVAQLRAGPGDAPRA
jgi:hypothetical protein